MLFTCLSSNISAIENIFSKYGWPGLLVAGAIAVLVYFIKQHLTKSAASTNKVLADGFNDLSKSMQDQNQKLLEAIIKHSPYAIEPSCPFCTYNGLSSRL